MRKLNDIKQKLESNNAKLIQLGIDGGCAKFTRGAMKGMTVIFTYGSGWEHVSIDGKNRMPEWNEMCLLKDIFFSDEECVVQYHPPKSEYVNNIPYCLHLWKPIEKYVGKMPMPESILVGIKGVTLQ